jgi:micrococcal nuclease
VEKGITIISWPETAYRNEAVTVKIQGQANTQYYIEVNYKSGPSTSEDLYPKTSNADGEVSWTWKVGGRSGAGTFDIIVWDDAGNKVSVEWTIVVN